MGAVGHATEKYLHPLCAGHVSLKYTHKITQKTGLDHHFIAGTQRILIAYNVCLVHADLHFSNQFIINRSWYPSEADNIGNPASEADIVQHLGAFKAGKYIPGK